MPYSTDALRQFLRDNPDIRKTFAQDILVPQFQDKLTAISLAKRAAKVGVSPEDFATPYVQKVIELLPPSIVAMFNLDQVAQGDGSFPVTMNDDTRWEGNWLTNTDGTRRRRMYGEILELAAIHGGIKPPRSDLEAVWEDVGKPVMKVIKTAAPFLAVIPVPGFAAIALAITVGASLALGDNIGEAALNGLVAYVPGGPVAQAAAKAGIEVGERALKGENVGDAVLAETRDRIAEEEGEDAAKAFDIGVKIAKGKTLQEAGFKLTAPWLDGSPQDKEAEFIAAVNAAAKIPNVSPKTILRQKYQSKFDAMSDADKQYAKRLASELSKRSDLASFNVQDVMVAGATNEATARAALVIASGENPWSPIATKLGSPDTPTLTGPVDVCARAADARAHNRPTAAALQALCDKQKATARYRIESIFKKHLAQELLSTPAFAPDRATRPEEAPSRLPLVAGGVVAVAVIGGIFWWRYHRRF